MYVLLITGRSDYHDYHDWTENKKYSLKSDRLFENTDQNISEEYKNNLKKLKELPCLFTYEFKNGKTVGYIGYIRSIKSINEPYKKKETIIEYSLDEYPSIKIDKNNDSDLLESLGITDVSELLRSYLAVKDINLFKIISESLSKQIPKKPRYTKKQKEDIWGKNYKNKTLLFFSYKENEEEKRMTLLSNIKTKLEEENFKCFIAKENISATLQWKEEIFKALDTMHIFIGFVTNDFHKGVFTNQEIGYAHKRGVPRIFLELENSTTKGFVSHEQTLVDIDWNNCHKKIIETIKARVPDLYTPILKEEDIDF